MAETPSTSFRLSRTSISWLERRSKETGRSKTEVLNALIREAAAPAVTLTEDDVKWLTEEGRRRGSSADAVLSAALRSARAAPLDYLAHVSAVQSWIAARLVTAMAYKQYGERTEAILDKAAADAAALFGPGPDKPAFETVTAPKALRRVFTDFPKLP